MRLIIPCKRLLPMARAIQLVLTLFFFACKSEQNQTSKKIEIIYFGGFDTTLISQIKCDISLFYHLETSKVRQANLPQSAFYLPRKRYRADSLIHYLKNQKPGNNNMSVGLCAEDISVSINNNQDWGVFGYGYCPGNACIISTFRLKKKEKNGFKHRLKNVILHEIGHNLGLSHCLNPNCLMADAKGKISSVEGENRKLCKNCQSSIDEN